MSNLQENELKKWCVYEHVLKEDGRKYIGQKEECGIINLLSTGKK